MSKQKINNPNKKELSPILKGFLITIGYFALYAASCVIIALIFEIQENVVKLISDLGRAITNSQDWTSVFDGRFTIIPYFTTKIIVNAVQNQQWIALMASAFSLMIILIILFLKKPQPSSDTCEHRSSIPVTIAAVVIGLGLGALFTGIQGLLNKLAVGIWESLPAERLAFEYYEFYYDHIATGNPLDQFKLYFLDAFLTGAFSHAPSASLSIVTTILHAIAYSIIFCAGVFDSFKKKMPTVLSLLLCVILYAFFSGSGNGIVFSLILGFFLVLVYIKSASTTTAILLGASSGFFGALGIGLQSLFGKYVYIYQYPFSVRYDIAYGPHFLSYVFQAQTSYVEPFYQTCSTIFHIAAIVIAIPLLIVGIILLCIAKKKPEQPVFEQTSSIEDTFDPFADDPDNASA